LYITSVWSWTGLGSPPHETGKEGSPSVEAPIEEQGKHQSPSPSSPLLQHHSPPYSQQHATTKFSIPLVRMVSKGDESSFFFFF